MRNILWQNLLQSKRKQTIPKTLKKIDLFSNLSIQELKLIEQIAHIRDFKEGDSVFNRYDNGRGMFIVLSGKVKLSLKNKKKDVSISKLVKYDYFGEMALFKEQERRVNAVCETRTKLLYIFGPELKELFNNLPKLGLKFYNNFFSIFSDKIKAIDEFLIKKQMRIK